MKRRRRVSPPVAMAARSHGAARAKAWVTLTAPTTQLRVFSAAFSGEFGGTPAITTARTVTMAARVHAAAFAKAQRHQRVFAAMFSSDFD